MSDKAAFLAAINERPDDKSTLLVFADWLAEHGEEVEAACYRAACDYGVLGWESITDALGIPRGWEEAAANPLPRFPAKQYGEQAGAYAARLIPAVTAALPGVRRADERARRWSELLARAALGDGRALLAHPRARAAACGSDSLEPFTRTRKAKIAARAILAERRERVRDRELAEAARRGTPGRWAARLLAKRRQLAVEIGREYHRTVRSLYTSQYADVIYGHGGEVETDGERYSRGWHREHGPARHRNAGARLDDETRPKYVILENFRGTEVARLPLPARP